MRCSLEPLGCVWRQKALRHLGASRSRADAANVQRLAFRLIRSAGRCVASVRSARVTARPRSSGPHQPL